MTETLISKHRLYQTWIGMKSRCSNPNTAYYSDYGGRGITVCEEWLDSVTFIAWAEQHHKEGLTLDRIDNNKGYSPENCRFATWSEQNSNRRPEKKSKNNTSGYKCVYWVKRKNQWQARASSTGNHLGFFDDLQDAVAARKYFDKHGIKPPSKARKAEFQSGVTGVRWNSGYRKWFVYKTENKKEKHLGTFENLPDAITARKNWEVECRS